MYCPNCSQQQVSEEVRFCSRCGFSLIAVRELIASGGALLEHGGGAQAGQISPGQRVVRRGAWMMLASLALTVVVGILSAIDDDFAVLLLLPLLGFVIGVVQVLYGVFVSEKRARRKRAASQPPAVPIMPGQLGTAARPELPPPRVAPIESFAAPRVDTAKMVQPPSVTENTTRLLDEESDPRRS